MHKLFTLCITVLMASALACHPNHDAAYDRDQRWAQTEAYSGRGQLVVQNDVVANDSAANEKSLQNEMVTDSSEHGSLRAEMMSATNVCETRERYIRLAQDFRLRPVSPALHNRILKYVRHLAEQYTREMMTGSNDGVFRGCPNSDHALESALADLTDAINVIDAEGIRDNIGLSNYQIRHALLVAANNDLDRLGRKLVRQCGPNDGVSDCYIVRLAIGNYGFDDADLGLPNGTATNYLAGKYAPKH